MTDFFVNFRKLIDSKLALVHIYTTFPTGLSASHYYDTMQFKVTKRATQDSACFIAGP